MKSSKKFKNTKKSIMVLGTSSGSGKSLTVTAICRILKNMNEVPIPFKAQNMSNNAIVGVDGGEMAYSQALQAYAAGVEPESLMNPILLKPQGDSISEVIHLGKSVGITSARSYYDDWIKPGWRTVKGAIENIYHNYENSRLIVEGAGSPVEMNLIQRDIANLKLAKYLNANCILVADIERGGVFAQIIGTLKLLKPDEVSLIKGIVINKFRGDISLFNEGKKWIEKETKIPILGIIPYLNEQFPPEDSLDLLNRKSSIGNYDMKIGVIKFPSISNFSDITPLENEESLNIKWIDKKQSLKKYDLIILPGSKQSLKDKKFLQESGILENILEYSHFKSNIFGICGGMQILGEILEDPFLKEGGSTVNQSSIQGLALLPIKTRFEHQKTTRKIISEAIWPCLTKVEGFEIHNGKSELNSNNSYSKAKPLFKEEDLGWFIDKGQEGSIAGTYLHGIFENDIWRDNYINLIRKQRNLPPLDKEFKKYKIKREVVLNNLASQYSKHLNINPLLN